MLWMEDGVRLSLRTSRKEDREVNTDYQVLCSALHPFTCG